MSALLRALAGWKPFTALVVGDFMLDQLVYGDAERLSPDAPVPVLQVRREEHRPGGAANVCLNLIEMRASVLALGVTGADTAGRDLRAALQAQGVDASGLIDDDTRPTTVKRSYIGLAQHRHPQKMFRVDAESREPLDARSQRALLARVQDVIHRADVVCLEDYDKGVCTPAVCQGLIAIARQAGKPVLVDPANLTDYSKYRGATCITPNRTEAERATGLKTSDDGLPQGNAALAVAMLEEHELEAVVLTLDRHGALLLERAAPQPVHVPTVARQVYDVTGAGDMVLAGLAAARANGCSWLDAVRLANAAAGLEVEVFGVQPIPLERIHHAVLQTEGRLRGKLRTPDEAAVEAAAVRRAGGRVVFTNGCFDILHSGHVKLLEQARAQGDYLVVGLNDDASVQRLKGPARPVNSQDDRARVLSALDSVNAVVLFSQDTPIDLIAAVRPDVLVKGGDYTKDRVVGADLVEQLGGRVVLIDLIEGRSTTAVIERLRAQVPPREPAAPPAR